jgi:hypothetical protein
MGMRVDETWANYAVCGVELLRAARHWMGFNLRAGADSGDEAIGDKHCSIF